MIKNCGNNTFCPISEHKNTCYFNGKMATLKNGEIINLKKATLPLSNGMAFLA